MDLFEYAKSKTLDRESPPVSYTHLQRLNLDRGYFGKIFKEVIGQAPQEFLIHYRMSRACLLYTSRCV